MNGASFLLGKTSAPHIAPQLATAPHPTRSAAHAGSSGRVDDRAAGPSTSPPNTAPFLFTVDGNGLLSRRTFSAGSGGGQRGHGHARAVAADLNGGAERAAGSETDRPGGRTRTPSSNGGRRAAPATAALSMASAGLLPSAVSSSTTMRAPPFTMRWVGCGVPLSNSGKEARTAEAIRPTSAASATVAAQGRRTSSPDAAAPLQTRTRPRVNNYLASPSATWAVRSASTGRGGTVRPLLRPPRVPTAASVSTSPSLTPVSSCETSTSSVHQGEHAGRSCTHGPRPSPVVADRDSTSNTTTTAAAAARSSCTGAPSIPQVRPVPRRLPRPCAAADVAAAREDAQIAAEVGSTSSATTTRSDTGSSSRARTKAAVRRPHVPFVQMTRSSALRRPVLLTKDVSAAAAAAAAIATGTRGASLSPSRDASLETLPSSATVATASSSAARPTTAAAAIATAYIPAPPQSSSQPRRLPRSSQASLASNLSTTILSHRHSLDEAAAAARLFFQSMPSFAGVEERKGEEEVVEGERGKAGHYVPHGVSGSPTAAAGAVAAPVRGEPRASAHPLRRRCSADHSNGPLHHSAHGSANSIASFRSSKGGEKMQPPQQRRRSSSQGVQLNSTTELRHTFADAAATSLGAGSVVDRLRERGNHYMLREEFPRAIATYSEAIRLAPRHEALWGNRASAFLLTFRYLPAVADCLYVLSLKPGSVKAYWRAARAYAAAYCFLDAKKYYLLAQQACLKETCRASAAGTTDGGCDASSISSSSVIGRSSGSVGEAAEKAARDRRVMAAEEGAVEAVEGYFQHVRKGQWTEAVAVVEGIFATGGYAGPTAVSWQALRLEALVFVHPKAALAEAEALHRVYPDALELYYVLAKSLFFTVHDAGSTRRCLQLLHAAAERRSAQNTLLNVHVRYAAMQLRECLSGEGGDTAAVQMETWGRRSQLREDSRIAELRHSIDKFVRHRDAGNAAYERGSWDVAAAAYTQCLQTDRLNHALLAIIYCNRTAVYMQAGRWREALGDADAAIQHSPLLATAYGRRGRIQLHLLSQEYEAQRAVLSRRFVTQWSAAAREELTRLADAAAGDLTRAVELSPTADHKAQLQKALAQRQALKSALSAQATRERWESTSSASPHSASKDGASHQRTYANAHWSSSSSSPPPSSAQAVLQQHLRLLGLPSATALPDLKVVAKAYRKCALRWHPDKWVSSSAQEQQEAERRFKLISVAYTCLRERYADAARVA